MKVSVISMESVDKVGRREKFMQQTYDFHPGGFIYPFIC